MRVFLDTNVLFSGLHSPHGAPARILEAVAHGDIEAAMSVDVLEELLRNVQRKAPQLLDRLYVFLSNTPLEITASPPLAEIARWYGRNFGSDATIVAGATQAAVDSFCTGDRRLRDRLAAARGRFSFIVLTPAELARQLPSRPNET